jgi:hypothetical protein
MKQPEYSEITLLEDLFYSADVAYGGVYYYCFLREITDSIKPRFLQNSPEQR